MIEFKGKKYYHIEDIAEMLDMAPRTIREYFRDGRLKGIKIGKRWYATINEIERIFKR